MSNILSKSKEMSAEYCATVVRLGEVKPIENADKLGTVIVEGREIVVRKDATKENDVMIYVQNECQLDADFLSKNNEFQDIELNANYEAVKKTLEVHKDDMSQEEVQQYLQEHRGYFDKHCRVRMKKLRGVMSMGYLIRPEQMVIYNPACAGVDWASLVGEDFDTVDGKLFVKAYVPETKEQLICGNKRNKQLKKLSRMIPGQFSFHYDTQQLQREIRRLNPETDVTISVKLHGTSSIIGNLLVKKPKYGGLYTRWFRWLPKFLQKTVDVHDIVYASRSVIVNDDINPDRGPGWDGGQVQQNIGIWAGYIGKYLPEGMTTYGEIVGYYEGTTSAIQSIGKKPCDYGSEPKSNQLMIYRISQKTTDGTRELEINEIQDFVRWLKQQLEVDGHKDIADRLRLMDILFQGKMKDLYPDLNPEEHWHEEVLERLKLEPRFLMEQDEPLCKSKMPREGFVLRITGDPVAEAFKLKCVRFLNKEADDVDQGRVDAETAQRYEA